MKAFIEHTVATSQKSGPAFSKSGSSPRKSVTAMLENLDIIAILCDLLPTGKFFNGTCIRLYSMIYYLKVQNKEKLKITKRRLCNIEIKKTRWTCQPLIDADTNIARPKQNLSKWKIVFIALNRSKDCPGRPVG